jgi:hypothetical protein
MEANFVQIGDENYINLMNLARVRFTNSCAEVFYTGGQSESVTDPVAIENLRRAIGAEVAVRRQGESRKAMEVAYPDPSGGKESQNKRASSK